MNKKIIFISILTIIILTSCNSVRQKNICVKDKWIKGFQIEKDIHIIDTKSEITYQTNSDIYNKTIIEQCYDITYSGFRSSFLVIYPTIHTIE